MNALRFILLVLALVVGTPFAARAAETLPPAPTHYVTDNENLLSSSASGSTENELRDYEQTTGHQVIVWIGDTTGDTQLEQWTVDAAEKWGVGRKGQDDGAVLFVFTQDHKLRIEVGYGLEPSLTDAQANQIIDTIITPKMRAGDYDAAIRNGVDAMLVTITPSFASHIGHEIATPEPAEEDSSGNPIAFFLVFGFVLLIMLFVVFVRSMQYLFLLLTQGPAAAHKMWHTVWITSGIAAGGLYGWSGGGSSGGSFGGFSGGGGGFGGGGASGGW